MTKNNKKDFDEEDQEFSDIEAETTKKKLGKAVYVQIKGTDVKVEDHQDARIIYDNGFYGALEKDKTLSLNFEETLHLMERGVIKVTDERGVWLELADCARLFSQKKENFWTDYLVYKDLRNRGYIVGEGISDIVKYRIYPRGAKVGSDVAKTMICPLSESSTINLETLDAIVTQSQSLKKRVLIACVDRLGDVSYYELQPIFK
ncbi:MAG: tRNA-intron lyase [Candidatus Heimdallarchaeota archaeon]|nr:tRNA-intron lyase [Candidatus Heimdallarchaeota archaeon]